MSQARKDDSQATAYPTINTPSLYAKNTSWKMTPSI